MKVTTKQQLITPKLASSILEEHYERIANDKFRQRRISDVQVNRFATDMAAGNWLLSPQPIVFDTDDNLIDGQHRLEAIRRSGKSYPMMVSRGWPVSKMKNGELGTIDIIDRGRPRSVGQQLVLHGDTYGIATASSVTAIVGSVYAGARIPSVSYASALFVLDKLDMRKHITAMTEAMRKPFAGRTLGPLALYRTHNAKKADEFANRLYAMNLEKDTGPQVYARYLRDYKPKHQMNAIAALARCLKAWDADESITRVRQTEEGVIWLSELNPKLAANIKELIGPMPKIGQYRHWKKLKHIHSKNDNATAVKEEPQ